MRERGQPMHAFDQVKLQGVIGVRFTKRGEGLTLVNDQEVEYRPGMLAITDDRGPVALGGVMGGQATMVGAGTTEAFLESAFFHPEAIQGRARSLSLTSDAAHRFERGVDFAAARAALERATALVLEICGGSAGPVTEARGELPARAAVRVRPPRVRALLGYRAEDPGMGRILRSLACEATEKAGDLGATARAWRFDVAIEEDFV